MAWSSIQIWSSGVCLQVQMWMPHMTPLHRLYCNRYIGDSAEMPLMCHRGLIVDKELGNLCKVDRFGCVTALLTS